MALEGARGYRGGRHESADFNQAGRGSGRQPGRVSGRGGGRNKFSWKREDGSDRSNTTSSNVAMTSDDTSRWDAAATGKHQVQEEGVSVPKAQGSCEYGGAGDGRHVSPPPPRRPHGKQGNQVMEVEGKDMAAVNISSTYTVESPESAVGLEVIPTPPLVTEENLRFSLRNVQHKMERVDDKAKAAAKKRDIEGLMAGEDREAMERGAKLLKLNASSMMRICAAPRE